MRNIAYGKQMYDGGGAMFARVRGRGTEHRRHAPACGFFIVRWRGRSHPTAAGQRSLRYFDPRCIDVSSLNLPGRFAARVFLRTLQGADHHSSTYRHTRDGSRQRADRFHSFKSSVVCRFDEKQQTREAFPIARNEFPRT